jgi:iron complex transport system permease protein
LLATLAISAGLWAAAALLCLCVGSTGFSWPDAAAWEFRAPSIFVASLVGAALAAAGVTYQAILRNPLADPYLLGVSSGASLLVFLWALPFGTSTALLASFSQQGFAFVGALASVAIVFLLAQRRGRLEPITLLLVGVIVNAINGSIFLLLYELTLKQDTSSQTGGIFRFLIGGIQTNITANQKAAAALFIALGFVLLLAISGQLNVASLGEAEAQSLGVRIHRLRWMAMIVASLVTASAVAISGPIGFIGLICPHLARLIVGHDQRRVLPVATALGAALLALSDAGSRLLSQERFVATALPVGVITGLLGGPFFLLLLWQGRNRIARREGI